MSELIEIKIQETNQTKIQPLSYEDRVALIPALVDVARAYYEEPETISPHAGICYNLMEIAKVRGAYWKMGSVMQELGYNGFEYFEGNQPDDTKDDLVAWEKRAIMCLILSEYLYDTLEAELPEGDTIQALPTKPKSIFQKVKDKVNEFTENLRVYFEARGGLMSKLDKSERVSV